MDDESSVAASGGEENKELLDRGLFLRSLGKWSGAAIVAAVFGGAWVASPPEANAGGAWVNRRGGYGGGWINGHGGAYVRGGSGGTWINGGGGGGGWINRRAYGGGGAWVNRH